MLQPALVVSVAEVPLQLLEVACSLPRFDERVGQLLPVPPVGPLADEGSARRQVVGQGHPAGRDRWPIRRAGQAGSEEGLEPGVLVGHETFALGDTSEAILQYGP